MADRKQPFVISIDNLDRVSQSDALSVWSTLRAFSELQSFRQRKWGNLVWVVVPFDPAILKRWTAEGGNDNEDLSKKSFLAKNFQAIFRVPRLVLYDWQQFTNQQLRLALPNHDPADFEDVVRIMQLPLLSHDNPHNFSTPRDIKIFVNRLGALHRQWQHEVPLQMQALYLVLEDAKEGEGIENQLKQPNQPESLGNVPPGLIPDDWREWLTALHYNVPKERALHMLLRDKVGSVLQSGDVSYFKSQAVIPGFLRVVSDVIDYNVMAWVEGSPPVLALAARSISQLDDADVWVQRSRRQLCVALRKAKSWPMMNAPVAEGLSAMARWDASEEFASSVLSLLALAAPTINHSVPEQQQAFAKEWASAFSSVVQRIVAAHPRLRSKVRIASGNAGFYLQIAGELIASGESRDTPELLKPLESRSIINQLAGVASQGAFREREEAVLEVLLADNPSEEFSGLARNLSVSLYPNNRATWNLQFSPLQALLRLSVTVKAADDALRESVQSGAIATCLTVCLENGDQLSRNAIAACFMTMLLYRYRLLAANTAASDRGIQFFEQKLRQATDRELVSDIGKLARSLGLTEKMKSVSPPPSVSINDKFYLMVRQEMGA